MSESLNVGDKLRFSVQLIERIREMDGAQTLLVTVAEITKQDDGTKTVKLKSEAPHE